MVQLLFLGREYPLGYDYFQPKCKRAFMGKRALTEEADVKKAVEFGEYICRELETLYHIKKFRAMKSRYETMLDGDPFAVSAQKLEEKAGV